MAVDVRTYFAVHDDDELSVVSRETVTSGISSQLGRHCWHHLMFESLDHNEVAV